MKKETVLCLCIMLPSLILAVGTKVQNEVSDNVLIIVEAAERYLDEED